MRRAFFVMWTMSMLAGGEARADDAAKRADELFEEAVRLSDEGAHAEACPVFEKTLELAAGNAARFRLAQCYEALGKLALAWRTYHATADEADAAGLAERASYARAHARALEGRMATVELVLTPGGDRARIVLDGKELARERRESALRVDPGVHRIEAHAPGRVSWSTDIDAAAGEAIRVAVPPLAFSRSRRVRRAPEVAARPAALSPAADDGDSVDGALLAGALLAPFGVSAAAVAVGLEVAAADRFAESEPHCTADHRCDSPAAVALRGEGLDLRAAATGLGIAGGAVAAAGIALIVYRSVAHDEPSDAGAAVRLAPDGLWIAGTW